MKFLETGKLYEKKQTHCDSAKMAEAFSTQKAKPTDETSSHYNQAVENSIRNPPVGYIFNSHHIKWSYRFNEDIEKYNPLLDSLEQAFAEPLFCCGGSLQPPNMNKFVLKLTPTTPEANENDCMEGVRISQYPFG